MTKRKGKKIYVFEALIFFENILLLSISRNSLQTPSSGDINEGNFSLSNSIIFVEDLIKWKRGLKHFWSTAIFEIQIFLVRNKKVLLSLSPTLYYVGQSTQDAISIILGSCNICIIYQYVTKACLKVIIAVLLLPFEKPFQYYEFIFFKSISSYSWIKISLPANIRKKCVTIKINLCFCGRHEKWPNFSIKSLLFSMITDSFLVEK